MRVWKTGERCQVKVGSRMVEGTIKLASTNGKSLFIEFEALLAGHVGSAPLSWHEGLREFVSIASGVVFELSDPPAEAASS